MPGRRSKSLVPPTKGTNGGLRIVVTLVPSSNHDSPDPPPISRPPSPTRSGTGLRHPAVHPIKRANSPQHLLSQRKPQSPTYLIPLPTYRKRGVSCVPISSCQHIRMLCPSTNLHQTSEKSTTETHSLKRDEVGKPCGNRNRSRYYHRLGSRENKTEKEKRGLDSANSGSPKTQPSSSMNE